VEDGWNLREVYLKCFYLLRYTVFINKLVWFENRFKEHFVFKDFYELKQPSQVLFFSILAFAKKRNFLALENELQRSKVQWVYGCGLAEALPYTS